MKKRILLCFTIILLIVCTGCDASINSTEYTINSYDEESRIEITVSDQTNPAESSNAPSNASFLVKEKKLSFEGTELVLLDITNESNTCYSITISGSFYDQNGIELYSEKKIFDQFSAGFQNCFLFDPKINFSDFKYTIEVSPYSGAEYAKGISFHFVGIEEGRGMITSQVQQGDLTKYPTLYAKFTYRSDCDVSVMAAATLILYNANDEIVAIKNYTPLVTPEMEFGDDEKVWELCQTTDDKLIWPEKYKGEIKALICIRNVTDQIPQ